MHRGPEQQSPILEIRSFVSAITGWEIAYKRVRKRIVAPENLDILIEERGFTHLPLTFHHAECAAGLPMHHRDPFDRFLIAQAQSDGVDPGHPRRANTALRNSYIRGVSIAVGSGIH